MTDNQTPITDQDKKALLDQKALEDYVDNLIKEKNSPYVNGQNRQEIKNELLKNLSKAINKKLIEKLSDQEVDELNVLLDQKADDPKISNFFTSKINNIDQLITEVLIDFRKGYLSVVYKRKKEDVSEAISPAPVIPVK